MHASTNIDAVKIIVDKDVITLAEYQQRIAEAKLSLAQQGQVVSDKEIEENVQEQLIVESLQLQIADRSGFTISNEELSAALTDIAARNHLDLEGLKNKIESEGQNYIDFRERIRKDILIQQIQQGHLRSKVQISDKEVDNYLGSAAGKKLTQESYDISFISYPLNSNASDKEDKQAKRFMEKLKQSIQSGKYSFENLVKGQTIEQVAIKGSNLGRKQKDELPSLFAEKATDLNSQEISAPIRSGSGWHLVKMNKKVGGTQVQYQVHAKHILLKPSTVRSNAQAKALSDDLYQRLENGEDFALLAKEYSDDTGSALQGGDLGWSNPNNYVPAFVQALESLKPGETSQPIESSFGWHIVHKIDERDHDVTRDQQRNKARQILGQRQYNEALEAWLSKLKGEAFIEIKR